MKEEIEHRWRDLGGFIRDQRHTGHLSLRKLSEMAGISNPYLSQIERGLRKPSAEILQQIARALEISSETLYVRAGILEEREGEADLVADIRRDPYITEDHKKTLVQIYLSFRQEAGLASGAGTRAEAPLAPGASDAAQTERSSADRETRMREAPRREGGADVEESDSLSER